MHNSVDRFSNRVENYVAYRPTYPASILKFLSKNIELKPSSVIADIGSGTGISSKLFLGNGNKVFGIEPNELMRRAAEEYLKDFPDFVSIEGTSQKTNLPDRSIDVVVAAQAFHWFDYTGTPKEFHRILKEGGYIVLIWNERQLDSTEFLAEYEQFLLRHGTDYSTVRHDQIGGEVLTKVFGKEFRKETFINSQILDFEGLKGRMFSASYMPPADSPRYEQIVDELRQLFTRHKKNDRIEIIYDSNIYFARF